jgi:TolA-binding protein
MRLLPFAALLILAATPAAAQRDETVEQRVQRIEKELRAVQRKVFPGGAGMTVEPEIGQPRGAPDPAGVPASSAIADLSARLDAIEAQLRTLTAQSEENAHRIRQLETGFNQLRTEASPQQGTAQSAAPPAPAASAPAETTVEAPTESAAAPSTGDPGEDAYLVGFRHWEAGRFVEAQAALEDMIKKYPKHTRASFAQNLLGRALLDGGKPAAAAKVFLANYQNNPKGDRAADSLYFLGLALVRLEKRPEACKVYAELDEVYGANMRGWVRQRLPKAREDARCS